MKPREVYLGLGSNLGDRFAALQEAVNRLGDSFQVIRLSPVYESPPVGFTAQGPFLNAVVAVVTDLELEALLRRVEAIEHDMGRIPTFRYGPRRIDIDILLAGDELGVLPKVPHPAMIERPFVLQPLVDIAPDAVIPGHGLARRLLDSLECGDLRRWHQVLDAP